MHFILKSRALLVQLLSHKNRNMMEYFLNSEVAFGSWHWNINRNGYLTLSFSCYDLRTNAKLVNRLEMAPYQSIKWLSAPLSLVCLEAPKVLIFCAWLRLQSGQVVTTCYFSYSHQIQVYVIGCNLRGQRSFLFLSKCTLKNNVIHCTVIDPTVQEHHSSHERALSRLLEWYPNIKPMA